MRIELIVCLAPASHATVLLLNVCISTWIYDNAHNQHDTKEEHSSIEHMLKLLTYFPSSIWSKLNNVEQILLFHEVLFELYFTVHSPTNTPCCSKHILGHSSVGSFGFMEQGSLRILLNSVFSLFFNSLYLWSWQHVFLSWYTKSAYFTNRSRKGSWTLQITVECAFDNDLIFVNDNLDITFFSNLSTFFHRNKVRLDAPRPFFVLFLLWNG